MQFQFIEDLREAGIADLVCDCGASFGNGESSLENALRHVAMWHNVDIPGCDRKYLLMIQASKLLSPNPILIDGGSQCRQETLKP
jgi:hypothetical protein